jgi:hypothetical protein
MTPEEIENIVLGIVTGWLAPLVHQQPDQIDVTKTFGQAPPGGLGLTNGAYEQMCDDCTTQINTQLGCHIIMSGPWRTAHYNQSIAIFVSDTVDLITAAGAGT